VHGDIDWCCVLTSAKVYNRVEMFDGMDPRLLADGGPVRASKTRLGIGAFKLRET